MAKQQEKPDRSGVKIVALKTTDADRVRYVARWVDHHGTPKQKSLGKLGLVTDAQREAWAVARAASLKADLATMAAGGDVVEPPMSPLAAAEDWLAGKVALRTRSSHRSIVLRFVEWLKDNDVEVIQDVRKLHLSHFRQHYLRDFVMTAATGERQGRKSPGQRTRAPSSIKLALVVIKGFMYCQSELGRLPFLAPVDITRYLKNVKVPKRAISFLRPAQARALLEAAARHDRDTTSGEVAPFVMLTLLTGFRFSEAADLQWCEVDLQGGEITLTAARVKTRESRTVRLDVSPTALDLLRRLRLRSSSDVLVFNMARGRADRALRRLITTFGAPRCTWHDLRRTCATLLVNGPGIYPGTGPWQAAHRLGHDLAVLRKSYATLLPGLPTDAKTIEDAAGIRDQCQRIVESVGGVTTCTTASATATG